jgi:hypothetical protein
MTNKFLFSIIIASVIVMAGSIAYVNYENHVQTSGYPDYHVNVHIPTVVDNYPIELSGVPNGTGFYQQLITISNPSSYGINTAGSNVQFTAQNGTLLYAWEQSINSSALQVWIKNYYGNSVIDMQVLPSFENLFSATGYLGEAPQLSSTYAEYDNGKYVFLYYWNFAGTTLPSGWTVSSGASATVDNGVTVASTEPYEDVGMYYSPISFGSSVAIDAYSIGTSTPTAVIGFDNGIASDGHGGDNPNNAYTFMSSPTDGSGLGIVYWSSGIPTTISGLSVSPKTTPYILTGAWDGSNLTEFYNYSQQISSVSNSTYSQSYMNTLIVGTKGANIANQQDTYQWVNVRTYLPSMPTFTIGTGSVFQANATADNYNINIAYNHQNITVPSGNWYNVSLKAYSNYSYSFYYNDSPMYFNYSGLINNTFYTGFLDRNVTISLNFVGSTYSGTTSLIVLEKGE